MTLLAALVLPAVPVLAAVLALPPFPVLSVFLPAFLPVALSVVVLCAHPSTVTRTAAFMPPGTARTRPSPW